LKIHEHCNKSAKKQKKQKQYSTDKFINNLDERTGVVKFTVIVDSHSVLNNKRVKSFVIIVCSF
jgi:hypothetical protein